MHHTGRTVMHKKHWTEQTVLHKKNLRSMVLYTVQVLVGLIQYLFPSIQPTKCSFLREIVQNTGTWKAVQVLPHMCAQLGVLLHHQDGWMLRKCSARTACWILCKNFASFPVAIYSSMYGKSIWLQFIITWQTSKISAKRIESWFLFEMSMKRPEFQLR